MDAIASLQHLFGIRIESHRPAQHGRVDGAGTDAVHAYAFLRVVECHGTGETEQAVLGSYISGGVGNGGHTLDRTDHDDCRITLLEHVRHGEFGDQEAAFQVHSHQAIPCRFGGGDDVA